MIAVEYRGISKEFGTSPETHAGLSSFSIQVPARGIQVWLGPSGSGKSTAARLLAGLESPDEGSIFVNGQQLPDELPHLRVRNHSIYYVFQNPSLYPHRTVEDNILFGLNLKSKEGRDYPDRLSEVLTLLFPDLVSETSRSDFLLKRPQQLSGGERQRVALSKALVRRQEITVFDEPLSSVDAPLRSHIRRGIREWQLQNHITCVWITHDHGEAVAVADTLAVIHRGSVLQAGTVDDLFYDPVHARVASFIAAGLGNPLNMLEGRMGTDANGGRVFQGSHLILPGAILVSDQDADRPVLCGIPADGFRFAIPGSLGSFEVEFEMLERNENHYTAICRLDGVRIFVRLPEAINATTHKLCLAPQGEYLLFDAQSERTIGRGALDNNAVGVDICPDRNSRH